MPRSVRDSDEDVEIIKIGRRTRAGTGPAIPESPIRRSSRNKQSTKQNDSSPDLSVIETSNTQTSRSFRTRAGTIDSNSLEIQRRLRSSRNITDMNEAKETEVSTETQPKIMTRRSIAAMNASETPKANTRVRRLTRAGSETKTTPTGRATRKTRASSMDPESSIENPIKEKYDSHVIDTPSRTKRRASVFPSESTVVEEEEKQIPYANSEKSLKEEDESAVIVSSKSVETSDKIHTLSKNESNEENKNTDKIVEEKDRSAEGSIEHSSQNDQVKISENVNNEELINKEKPSKSDENNILGNDKDDTNIKETTLTADVICDATTDSLPNTETRSEKVESNDKNILHVSLEEGELNTSNKENECLNISNPIPKQNKNESVLNVSLEEGELNTSNKENESLNIDNLISEQNKNLSSTKKLNLETSTNVLDSSTKEDKNDQPNDNTKLGTSCLMECSVAISNCDNLIQTFRATSEIPNDNLRKENNNVSIVDTKEVTSDEKHDHDNTEIDDKNNMDNIALVENTDVLNAVTQKTLTEEDTVPKQQSLLDDSGNTQMQSTTISEEDNLETANQSTNNTKEIHCEIEPEVNVSAISNNAVNISVDPKENLMDISMEENNSTENVEKTEIANIDNRNVSAISNNAVNISVDPKENLMDVSMEENNSTENVEKTEIANVDNDVKEPTTPKDSHTEQNDIPSNNENQDSASTTTHDSPNTIILQVSDNSIEESVHSTEQVELHSSECLIDLQLSKPSNSTLETNDSSTVTESHDGPEEVLRDEEGSKMKSSAETPKISKRKSVTELNISKPEKETQKDDVQNADKSDNVSNLGMLFQDISADEWKQKRQILNVEGENNSIHSTSTVKLENDSETECDHVLVDKEAWLAAENLKTMKDKETFDYDSDDTVVLKSKMDCINDKISNSKQLLSKESTQENDNADSSKLLLKKTQDTSNKESDKDECDLNVSLQNTSKKEKSLNKSKEDISNNSKSDLVKSSDKQLEEEAELTPSQKESEDHNKSESKLASPVLDRKEKKNRSLNSSSNKKNKLRKPSKKYNSLRISSSDEEDEDNNTEGNKDKMKGSEKKRDNKNYSTMVHIGSESDTCNSSDSSKSDTKNQSLRIPCFLFKNKNNGDESEEHGESDDEFNEDKSSKGSIDSDIDLEYNLGGKTIGKFSDDDIPGDECRASESESSDPDDNGSDLADFVVDDDEVEEEEEEEDDEDEEEDEDEDEREEEEQEQEEDEELDQEMKDEEITGDENERKGKDIVFSEEKEKDTSTKNLNVSYGKSDKKKNQKQKTSSEIHSAESAKDEMTADDKVNTSLKLDSTLSERKKKKKQKLHENSETIEETPKNHFNESDTTFTKKNKIANISLTCSTPKTDFNEHEQFKHNISSEKKKRKYIEKTSINVETEKVCSRNLSTDNSDNNKNTSTNSVNAKKRYSVEKNISADSLELVKDTNLPRSLLFKKAHLNKTMSPSSETPTTKYLKKQKLNDSAPLIKLDENTPIVSEKTNDVLELDSSLSAKKKKSIEASVDLNEQTVLRHKNLIFETGQISEADDKAESQTTSDNEKENSKCKLKVDDGKKKKKKNKKNISFQELDILDVEAKMVEDVNNDENFEVTSNVENKKNKKKNKNKKNVGNEDKRNDKSSLCFSAIQSFKVLQSNDAKNYKKCIEAADIPSKKKRKVTSEVPSLQVKEHSKKSLGWNVSKGSTSTNVEFSNDARENMEFLKSKHEALQAAKRAAESIKANKHLKKTMRAEQLEKVQPKKEIGQPKIESTIMTTSKRGIKRLSVDIIENLPDIPMRPHKKQKLLQKPIEATSNTIIKNGFTESGITKANKKCIPSNCGGTTEFDVVNLQKAKKQPKKMSAVATFRQKMLSRNSRYPVTSYIMYLQKQRALGGDQGFVKQF